MQSNTTKLSVATQAKLVEEFNLPDDIFEEMFIDEFAIQKREGNLEKTIVLKHNSAKIIYERCDQEQEEQSNDDFNSEDWN